MNVVEYRPTLRTQLITNVDINMNNSAEVYLIADLLVFYALATRSVWYQLFIIIVNLLLGLSFDALVEPQRRSAGLQDTTSLGCVIRHLGIYI